MTKRRWVGVGVGIALLAIAVLVWKLRGDAGPTGPSALPEAPDTRATTTGLSRAPAPTGLTGTVTPPGAAAVWQARADRVEVTADGIRVDVRTADGTHHDIHLPTGSPVVPGSVISIHPPAP